MIKKSILSILFLIWIIWTTNIYAYDKEVKIPEWASIIAWDCKLNTDKEKDGSLKYWAPFKIGNYYFDFGKSEFAKSCEWNKVEVFVKWTWKYTFDILDKRIVSSEVLIEKDIDNNEIEEKKADELIDSSAWENEIFEENSEVEQISDNITPTNEDYYEAMWLLFDELAENSDNEVSNEISKKSLFNLDWLSKDEKIEFIKNNKEKVYQDIQETLEILNLKVKYYNVDIEKSYNQSDVLSDDIQMIELYK